MWDVVDIRDLVPTDTQLDKQSSIIDHIKKDFTAYVMPCWKILQNWSVR